MRLAVGKDARGLRAHDLVFRIAGYGPARSQVWKNGPQSM